MGISGKEDDIKKKLRKSEIPPFSPDNLSGMAFRRSNNKTRDFLYVSSGCYKLTGYQPKELIGEGTNKYNSSISPRNAVSTTRKILAAVATASAYETIYRIKHAGGEIKWVSEEGMPVYDSSGECIYFDGFIRDITKTKKLETNLRYFNARLKLINDIASELVGKLPLKDMVNKMLSEIVKSFGVDAGIVRVLRDEGLVLLTKLNVPERSVLPVLSPHAGLAGKMLLTKSPVIIKNTNLDPVTIPMLNRHTNEFRFISFVGAPLIVQEKILGVIGLYTTTSEMVFSEEDQRQLQIAANHIGVAIENNRLFTDLEMKKSELETQINVRREAEDALYESRSQLNMIISTTNIVLYQRDLGNAEFRYISPAIEKITGYTSAELNCVGLETLIQKVENLQEKKQNKIGTFNIKNNQAQEFKADYQIKKKDGTLCWVTDNSYPWYDSDGSLIGSIGVLIDITERKFFEKQIREEKNKSQQLMDNSPVAIALLNTQGNIVSVNDAFCRLFGYVNTDIYHKNIDELIAPPELLESAKKLSQDVFNASAVIQESTRKKSNGEHIFVQIAGVPVISDGKTIAIYGLYVDLTERQKIEEIIRNAKDKSDEASRLKSSFLANMSHELRTPLIGILGYSEILKDEAEDEKTRSMAAMINKGGLRLLENLNLILDMSRVESGKMKIEKQKTKIELIVQEVVALFSKAALKKGLYIRNEMSPVPEIMTDPRLMLQILNNLVNNAIKFTTHGGITIMTAEYKGILQIKIQDTGVGIRESDRKIIWEEFRQASEGYGRTYEGTGLGLSITRKFVDKLGGRIFVESTPGIGSTFTIEFPIIENPGNPLPKSED